MPEPSPERRSRLRDRPRRRRARHALTPSSADVMFGGVVSGPETERIKRKGIGIGGWLCVAWLLLILFMAFFGSKIPGIPDPVNDVGTPRLGWGASGHPFGTDGQGRDVLSLIVNGTYNSMYIGIVSVFFGLLDRRPPRHRRRLLQGRHRRRARRRSPTSSSPTPSWSWPSRSSRSSGTPSSGSPSRSRSSRSRCSPASRARRRSRGPSASSWSPRARRAPSTDG